MNKQKFLDLGLDFDDHFYNRCEQYHNLLQQWGSVHNLSGQLKSEQIYANIIDSVYPLKFINDFESLADVGTGAGYPGMILAIARPEINVTLVEPREKRVAFLNFVKAALKLPNVHVVQKRVEELEFQKFDLISSRAVTNTTLLLDITKNISDEHTEFLFYKGTLCDQELEEIQLNNYEIVQYDKHRNYLYIKR